MSDIKPLFCVTDCVDFGALVYYDCGPWWLRLLLKRDYGHVRLYVRLKNNLCYLLDATPAGLRYIEIDWMNDTDEQISEKFGIVNEVQPINLFKIAPNCSSVGLCAITCSDWINHFLGLRGHALTPYSLFKKVQKLNNS